MSIIRRVYHSPWKNLQINNIIIQQCKDCLLRIKFFSFKSCSYQSFINPSRKVGFVPVLTTNGVLYQLKNLSHAGGWIDSTTQTVDNPPAWYKRGINFHYRLVTDLHFLPGVRSALARYWHSAPPPPPPPMTTYYRLLFVRRINGEIFHIRIL